MTVRLVKRQVAPTEVGTRLRTAAFLSACLTTFVVALQKLGPPLLRHLLAVVFGFGRPLPGSIRRIADLKVPGGAAGVSLATDLYVRDGGKAPTLLVRTPYAKRPLQVIAYLVSAQGFNVVLQDCRGRFDSTGEQTFGAFEDSDGVATLDWLCQQRFEWYDPSRVVMFGISYLGIVQWALVAGRHRRGCSDERRETPAQLSAITPLFAASRLHDIFYTHNTFRLDFYLRYVHFMLHVNSRMGQALFLYFSLLFELRYRRHAHRCLSIRKLHKKLRMPRLFKYNPRKDSRFWKNRDYSDAIAVAPPALVATGWHDIMLESSLRDYAALVRAHGLGHSRLMVGPWHHLESVTNLFAFRFLLRTSIDFLKEKTGLLEPRAQDNHLPVRLWVMGGRAWQGEWQYFRCWPPEEARDELMVLGHRSLVSRDDLDRAAEHLPLVSKRSSRCNSSSLKYDAMDPTPSVGGSCFNLLLPCVAGDKPQDIMERRGDVLLFDSCPLEEDLTVVGHVRLRLTVRSSRPHFDIFARLCDLHPSGRSYNVCDAILRHSAPTERAQSHQEVQSLGLADMQKTTLGEQIVQSASSVELTFSATAKRFQVGHCIRLLVAGGTYPHYVRNYGDVEQTVEEEPLEVEAYTLEIMHDEQTPSTLYLPVVREGEVPYQRSVSLTETAAGRSSPKRRPSIVMDAALRRIQSDAALK